MEGICGIMFIVVFVVFVKLLTLHGEEHESVNKHLDHEAD